MTAFTRRAGIQAAATAGALLAGGRTSAALAAQPTPVRTRSLADLTGMLGVCMETTGGGVWGEHAKILTALRELGATWFRSPFSAGNNNQAAWCRELGANGVKLNAMVVGPGQGATPEATVKWIAGNVAGALHSIEGTNEWDLKGGVDWPTELRDHQTRLYRAAKANSATRRVPVLAPAFGTPWRPDSYDAFGYAGDICDMGNSHIYTGGFVPGYRSDLMLDFERRVTGPLPQAVTETGWHNAIYTGTSHLYTPEDVAGVYAPRLLLEYFIRDTPKVAIYELVDDARDPEGNDRESHFGLLRFDFSRKPAFISLANFMRIINLQFRVGGQGMPAPLQPRVTVGDGLRDTDVRTVLVPRPDGRHLVFVWRSQAAIYEPRTRVYLNPGRVAVSLDWSISRRVRRYVPNRSATARDVTVTSRTELSVGAEAQVLIVEPE
ncbi:MAG: hypothetical protein V9G19_10205 [Tetrasphaera sp.]